MVVILLSYPASAPLNILSKASFTRREAGRELGREPPPGEAPLGARRVAVPVLVLFKRMASSEWAGEGLGVRTLNEKKQKNKIELPVECPEAVLDQSSF